MVTDQITESDRPLVEVNNLKMYFPVTSGIVFQKKVADIKAVDDVSFHINKGETLGLVGESGCGKTTTGRCILQLYTPTEGEVKFNGEDVTSLSNSQMRQMRREMQVIFQDPYGSLNPRMTCGDIVGEPLKVHKLTDSKGEYRDRVSELLTTVGLSPYMGDRYPHEFSGGQRQRIAIARSLANEAQLIILDEPVASLDASIRSQIINLLKSLQRRLNLSYLMISHDLAASRHLCDKIAVMYLGQIVEFAPCDSLFDNPQHPYTKALLSAALPAHPKAQDDEILLTGEIPSPTSPPSGCRFHTRCPSVMDHCSKASPELDQIKPDHLTACYLFENHN